MFGGIKAPKIGAFWKQKYVWEVPKFITFACYQAAAMVDYGAGAVFRSPSKPLTTSSTSQEQKTSL
ncbi:hypothetical protein OOU_Y34scaffold00600g1 [Pyricularia oryzae Y34]|uniref:Uncharacterized protein n=1 Tax=Pyricularia oryzae (strain Y34) TaxID=1143189 RepID=A0AA97NW62_PYRO3|nr:hypothetical protein OOU_Y34scaffold00600g1 [Pyricularia oryzae Y34]